MRHRSLFFVIFLAFFSSSLSAQDAGKILDQSIRASGGSKTLSKIRTLTLEGVLTVPSTGQSGAYTVFTKSPNRYYLEVTLGPEQSIVAYNGKSAWQKQGTAAPMTLLGPEAVQVEAAARYLNSRLLSLKKEKFVLRFIGRASVRDRDALQVELLSPYGVRRQIFFDPQSHLIVKESAPLAGADEETFYSDYRAVSGVKLPHSIELHRGASVFQVTITRAAVNAPVREASFDFPRSAQAPLPDLEKLFKDVQENQKNIDKIKESYAATRTEDETELDGNGNVKRHELREFEIFYLNGQEISTLKSKDGKPLSEAEQKKESERVHKRIEEAQKRRDKREAKREKARREGKEDDEVGITSFLRACQFVNPRRELFRGQNVLVFDFEANPDYKPRNFGEKALHKLAGVIWIDEQARDVVRLEAYFAENLKLGGGLVVSLQKGSSFVFEQAFVNSEVWLPTYAEVHLAARFLLLKGLKVNSVTRYSDYRKFRVESLSEISAPKQ